MKLNLESFAKQEFTPAPLPGPVRCTYRHVAFSLLNAALTSLASP